METKESVPFLIAVFFLFLMIFGINAGEVPVAIEKAVNICLSCIGIQ